MLLSPLPVLKLDMEAQEAAAEGFPHYISHNFEYFIITSESFLQTFPTVENSMTITESFL